MKITVGSTNPVKVGAVMEAFQKYWPECEVEGKEVVSGVAEQPRSEEETKVIRDWFDTPKDYKKIKNHCKKFFVFHSDNDPYVSLGNGKELAKNLNTNLIFIHNAGHFNTSSGYTKFEVLFEKIKNII